MARMGFSTGTDRPPLLAKPMPTPQAFGDGSDWDRPKRAMQAGAPSVAAGRPPTDFGTQVREQPPGPGEGGLFNRMPATQVPQTMGFSGAPVTRGVGMPAPMPSGGITATVPSTPQMRPYGGRRRGYDPGWR
jgi:hypothetical protein